MSNTPTTEDILTAKAAIHEDDTESNLQYLTFRLEQQLYGVPINYVEQIINMQEVIEVPGYPPYAKGIVNLRGSIVPILDLRMRLGRTEGMYTQRTCIVIMSINDQQMGYIVDEVDAVVVVSNKQIEPPPHMRDVSEDKRYLTGIAKLPGENGVGEKIVLCLEPTKIELEDQYK